MPPANQQQSESGGSQVSVKGLTAYESHGVVAMSHELILDTNSRDRINRITLNVVSMAFNRKNLAQSERKNLTRGDSGRRHHRQGYIQANQSSRATISNID